MMTGGHCVAEILLDEVYPAIAKKYSPSSEEAQHVTFSALISGLNGFRHKYDLLKVCEDPRSLRKSSGGNSALARLAMA